MIVVGRGRQNYGKELRVEGSNVETFALSHEGRTTLVEDKGISA